MSMHRALLYSVLGLVACAGWSFAQTAPVSPTQEPAQPAADLDATPMDEAPPRVWVCAEYLLWRIPGQRLPALVGTIPTESAESVQNFPDSTIKPLFGDRAGQLGASMQSGLRLSAGVWLDPEQQFGVEAGFFQLAQGRQGVLLQSAADAPLGVTFRDPVAGQEVLIMDAVPGLRDGAVSVETSNRLWGAEANLRAQLPLPALPVPVYLLAGFRHLQFDEGLDISSFSAAVPGGHLPCG
jgi:hypothetical protein